LREALKYSPQFESFQRGFAAQQGAAAADRVIPSSLRRSSVKPPQPFRIGKVCQAD
jgi:hypothetical protein